MGHDAWTDRDMLRALHMVEGQGFTAQEAGDALGRSKGSVLGMIHRVNKDTDRVDETPHLNGSMPKLWWEKGGENRA